MSTYEIVDGVYKGPEVFEGYLDLRNSQVTDLGCLKEVGRSLYLQGTQITSLGNLKSVGGYLDLSGTKVKDLGNLKSVGGNLYLGDSQIKDLGDLKSVVGYLFLPDSTNIKDFKSYKEEAEDFLNTTKYKDYPLHMNHKNWIVRSEINKYLETGVAS